MITDQRRMYGDLAWAWPIISRKEHYVNEAENFARTIQQHTLFEPHTLLHLGCGGGHLDFTLKDHFQVTGIDISEGMLANARRLNSEGTYRVGDMRTVCLEQAFDAVIVADSIDYMLTEDDLRAACTTAFLHLKPGGVFCTYAEVTTESFQQNRTEVFGGTRDGLEITAIGNRYDPDPTDTTYEHTFIYLIRRGGRLEIETDRHLSGIFPLETWHRLLQAIGFEVLRTQLDDEDQIPMFVCVKPG
jgi:SAM-dependent methyltransferase